MWRCVYIYLYITYLQHVTHNRYARMYRPGKNCTLYRYHAWSPSFSWHSHVLSYKAGAKEAKFSRSSGWALAISSLSSYTSTAWGETHLFIFYFGILLAYGGWWFGEGTLGTICCVLWQVSSFSCGPPSRFRGRTVSDWFFMMCEDFSIFMGVSLKKRGHVSRIRMAIPVQNGINLITFQPLPGLGWFSWEKSQSTSTFYRQ